MLQKSFPTADPEALMHALAVCDNSIECAKAVRPSLHGSTALLLLLSTAKAEAYSQGLAHSCIPHALLLRQESAQPCKLRICNHQTLS